MSHSEDNYHKASTPKSGLRRYAWALFAVLANCFMAGGGFTMQSIAKLSGEPMAANVSAVFIVWSAIGSFGVLGLAFQARSSGTFVRIIDRRGATIALSAGVLNCCGMLSMVTAIAADPDSAGPISAMLPFSSVLARALAWVIFKEKLVFSQLIGISICACGPVFMALSDPSTAAIEGLIRGGLASLCFGIFETTLILSHARGAQSTSVVLIIQLVAGCAGLLGIGIRFMIGRGLQGLNPVTMLIALSSAVCWIFGDMCFQLSLAGPPRLADALLNTNSLGVVLLSSVVWHVCPNPMKLIGMLCCITGVAVLILRKPEAQGCQASFWAECSNLNFEQAGIAGVRLRTPDDAEVGLSGIQITSDSSNYSAGEDGSSVWSAPIYPSNNTCSTNLMGSIRSQGSTPPHPFPPPNVPKIKNMPVYSGK